MCGICGIVNRPDDSVDFGVLESMRDSLVHRGPDDAGILVDREVGLGFRRLSIIDLTTGHQPLTNEDRSVWVVFNGEIYNYIELKRDHLEGHCRFFTASDTEVILRMYERYGEDCVQYLNGMFAFAIWDRKKHQLFLARDRFGMKPLYYTVQNGALIFASEMRSILRHPRIRPQIEPTAIDEFITYGYINTPNTAFKNIYKLPEGHTLRWRRGAIHIDKYWDLDFQPDSNTSKPEAMARLTSVLEDSVRLHLRSDVPVGVFLSGGLDSTVIAGLAARFKSRLTTFSIGFDAGKEFNELAYARAVAEKFATDHRELILNYDTFAEMLPKAIDHLDEPMSDAAAVPLHALSLAAAGTVKVVLSGEGSDELFAGYPIYQYMLAIEQYRRLPQSLRSYVCNPLLLRMSRSPKLEKYVSLSDVPLHRRYLNVNLYDLRLRGELYNREFLNEIRDFDPVNVIEQKYHRSQGWHTLSRLQYLDIKTWLPNDILLKADRMSMAASIEMRTPFLDYRVAEYSASLPPRFKLSMGRTKYILRQAFKNMVPREILRRGKMGFPVPLASMFRGVLKAQLEELLEEAESCKNGLLETQFVRKLLQKHLNREGDHHLTLWRVLILLQWLRKFGASLSLLSVVGLSASAS